MIIKRWRLPYGKTAEVTVNFREWMVGFGFDYEMYYVQLGPLSIVYITFDTSDMRRL